MRRIWMDHEEEGKGRRRRLGGRGDTLTLYDRRRLVSRDDDDGPRMRPFRHDRCSSFVDSIMVVCIWE